LDDKRFRILAGGTALYMIMIWGAIVYSVWKAAGLFNWIGVDYALFTAGEQLLFSGRPATVYDLEAIARHVEPFQAYYEPNTGDLQSQCQLGRGALGELREGVEIFAHDAVGDRVPLPRVLGH